MFRRRYRLVLGYGKAREFLQLVGRLNAIEREHGWALTRAWNPTVGILNEMFMEADYADEDAYRTESGPRHGDEQAKAVWDEIYKLVVPASFTIQDLDELEPA